MKKYLKIIRDNLIDRYYKFFYNKKTEVDGTLTKREVRRIREIIRLLDKPTLRKIRDKK